MPPHTDAGHAGRHPMTPDGANPTETRSGPDHFERIVHTRAERTFLAFHSGLFSSRNVSSSRLHFVSWFKRRRI